MDRLLYEKRESCRIAQARYREKNYEVYSEKNREN
jgi:hypothetical protein